jgi:hypothetical protein
VRLISRHLVRLLKAAPSLQVLDAATISIQELLKHHSRAEGLEALAAAASGQPGGGSEEGQARGSREGTPAAAEGNLLFAALAPEVQVGNGAAVAARPATLPCRAVGAAAMQPQLHFSGTLPHILTLSSPPPCPRTYARMLFTRPVPLYIPHKLPHPPPPPQKNTGRPSCAPTSTPSTRCAASSPARPAPSSPPPPPSASGSSSGSASWCTTMPAVSCNTGAQSPP